MAEWLINTLGNMAISWAAWAQNRYFEPEHYHAPWVVYSHDGRIEQCEHPPEPLPGVAVWRRISDTDQYERVDVPPPTQEPATSLSMPIIQAVVRFHTHGRRQRRSRAKPRDFDITAELQRFQGYPALDWLHVGMCVKHAHGITVLPGQYTLSIIDAALELHELDEDTAAVFSACPDTSSLDPYGLGNGFDLGSFGVSSLPQEQSSTTLLSPPSYPPISEPLEAVETDPEPDLDEPRLGLETLEMQEEGEEEEEEDPEPDFDDYDEPDIALMAAPDAGEIDIVRVQDSDDGDGDGDNGDGDNGDGDDDDNN